MYDYGNIQTLIFSVICDKIRNLKPVIVVNQSEQSKADILIVIWYCRQQSVCYQVSQRMES